MHELLLTYCYSKKNFKNHAFVSLFKGIFVKKKIKLHDIWTYRISGTTLKIILCDNSKIKPSGLVF